MDRIYHVVTGLARDKPFSESLLPPKNNGNAIKLVCTHIVTSYVNLENFSYLMPICAKAA